MKRGSFIYYSLVGIAVVAIPSARCSNNYNYKKVLQTPQFLSQICDATTLHDIGKGYRDKFQINAADQLESTMMKESNGNLISKNIDNASLVSFVDKKVKDDFEEGRILVIQGWVISVTEAQQCALFSLTEPTL